MLKLLRRTELLKYLFGLQIDIWALNTAFITLSSLSWQKFAEKVVIEILQNFIW